MSLTRMSFTPSIMLWSSKDAGEDPDRWLVIGPDRAGNFLEVVVMTTAEGNRLAIHAMPVRARFRRLLAP